MKRKLCISLICILSIGVNAVDLGTISVKSSTIEDLSINKRTEVSTVNVIDEKVIEKIDPKNINDLLQTIPGITADVRNSAVEIHIRGIASKNLCGKIQCRDW